jgi:uncharacterized cupin superfamily protein
MTVAHQLRNLPLEPTTLEVVSAGEPDIRCCTLHRSTDSSIGVWEFGPGRFEWRVEASQSACVIEGAAVVDLCDGRRLNLAVGDSIFLPAGLKGTWVVAERLRTVAIRREGRASRP